MPAGRFRVPAQGAVPASGYLTLTITAPNSVSWTTDLVSVQCAQTSNAYSPTCKLYTGANVSPTAFQEGTFAGIMSTSDTKHYLNGGEALTAEWSGAQPGAVCTFILAGEQRQLVA